VTAEMRDWVVASFAEFIAAKCGTRAS
jgi:hypothetical protein